MRSAKTDDADLVPIGPFQQWLDDLVRYRRMAFGDDVKAVARGLGVDESTIRRWRDPSMTQINLWRADAIYVAAGQPHLLAVHYPHAEEYDGDLAVAV